MTFCPLYFDHDSASDALVEQLRAAGVDVVTAEEAGNRILTDQEQLEFATRGGRALYTANKGHFAQLHREWAREGRHHAGIIVRKNQRLGVGPQLRALLDVFETYPDGVADMLLWV